MNVPCVKIKRKNRSFSIDLRCWYCSELITRAKTVYKCSIKGACPALDLSLNDKYVINRQWRISRGEMTKKELEEFRLFYRERLTEASKSGDTEKVERYKSMIEAIEKLENK